jgi:undecaprenyl-diphosphatase
MNYSIFQFLNNLADHYDWIDDIMVVFAQDIVWIMLAVLACLWFTGKETNQKLAFYSLLSAFVALLIASFIISPVVNHSRPFVEHQVNQLISHSADASFPSDHATMAFSIAFSVLLIKRKLGVIMLALAVLTGIARVYVGVHYPGDIVGSMVLSLLVSVIVFALRSRLEAFPLFFIQLQRKLTARIRHIHEK